MNPQITQFLNKHRIDINNPIYLEKAKNLIKEHVTSENPISEFYESEENIIYDIENVLDEEDIEDICIQLHLNNLVEETNTEH
jgi:hypothetical protein